MSNMEGSNKVKKCPWQPWTSLQWRSRQTQLQAYMVPRGRAHAC